MDNFYFVGIGILLFCLMEYFFYCRYPLRKQVDAHCSRSFKRKALRGIRKKIFYTSVREKCKLDAFHIYHGNIILTVFLCATATFHLCLGNLPSLQEADCILLTILFTLITVFSLFIQPTEGYAYYRNEKHYGPVLAASTTIMIELLLLYPLVAWYIYLWRLFFVNT